MPDKPNQLEKRIAKRRATLDANVFSRLSSIYSASRVQGQRLLQVGGGISIVEWRTLWDLHEAEPLSVRDLAYVQRSDHSLLSRALPEMRRKGLIRTYRDAKDGRQTMVELLPKGREAFAKAAPIMQRRRAALREHFTQEEITNYINFIDRLEVFLNLPVEQLLEEETV